MFHWGEVQNALFREVASLEVSKSTWLVTWETSEKKASHQISFHFLTISSCLSKKISQYSFWQKTLNKAFPGSVEVIEDGIHAEVQKIQQERCTVQNYYTTHMPKYEHCPFRRISGASWHLLGKKRHTTLYKRWLSPSRGDLVFVSFLLFASEQTRVRLWQCL